MSLLNGSLLLQSYNAHAKSISESLSNVYIILIHINYKTPPSDQEILSHAQVLSLGKRNFLVIFTHYSLLSLALTHSSWSYWHFSTYSIPHAGFDVVMNVYMCVCQRMTRRSRLTSNAMCQTVSVRMKNRKRTNMSLLLRATRLH
jgi:hypothetical protein